MEKAELRLFLAIPLWDLTEARESPGRLWLLKNVQGIRWVSPAHWHITLRFLGNVPSVRLPPLRSELAQAARGHKPFPVVLKGLGGFPRISRARVIWVGVSEGAEPLRRLADTVRESTFKVGCPGDAKPFAAHLTLGRARSGTASIQVPPELFDAEWGRVQVESFALVKSDLQPAGPIYNVLETFSLEG